MKAPAAARGLLLWSLVLPLGAVSSLPAQQLLVDRGVRAADLWCFPLESNPREYVYLPSGARLATDDEGNPQFSFIRYVINSPGEGGDSTITDAGGGGVLHFLVMYDTPDRQVRDAEALLRSRLQDDEIRVRGPMVFQDGRYTLVSSIVQEGAGERQVLATGRAPVLEGNRLALSFDLDPQQSMLLLESFKMATPDVSLVFDMTIAGLTEAYEATLTVDWSEVKKSEKFSAGASIYFVSAEVELGLDELLRENAIRLESAGSDVKMEALLAQVYDKLLELMFRPVAPEQVPAGQSGGLMDALGALVGGGASGNTTGFGAHVGYQLKDLRSEGLSVLDFNHKAAVERHGFITFNIGDLFARYGEDARYFRTVNLGDAAFQQREVHVAVDGGLLPEFERYINNVTVTLRKQHQNGAETLRELVLDKAAVENADGDLRMIYGWDGDDDRLAWLQYDYRTRWSFQGGGSYDTDWRSEDGAMIDLFAPYERREVDIVGSAAELVERGVRAVVVRLEYPFFAETRSERVVMRPEKGEEEQRLELTLPLGQYAYDYEITWMLSDGSRRMTSGSDETGVLFVDEVPSE